MFDNPLAYQAYGKFWDLKNRDFHSHNLQEPKETLDTGLDHCIRVLQVC